MQRSGGWIVQLPVADEGTGAESPDAEAIFLQFFFKKQAF